MCRRAGRQPVKGILQIIQKIEIQLPFARKYSDEDIVAAAIACFAWDVSVPINAVKVKLENCWVTLAGQVDWHYQKEAAEQDVRCLSGMTGVWNQVILTPRINAAGISEDISHAIYRSWFSDDSDVTVTAEDGCIRLTGTVHSPHDRQVAVATAWAAPERPTSRMPSAQISPEHRFGCWCQARRTSSAAIVHGAIAAVKTSKQLSGQSAPLLTARMSQLMRGSRDERDQSVIGQNSFTNKSSRKARKPLELCTN